MTTETNDLKQISLQDVINVALEEAEEALKHPYVFKKPIKNVAVIGAGPSGLPSARHLRDAGFNVRVFDRNSFVGGLWVYSDKAPLKPKIPSVRVKREVDHEALSVSSEEREKKTLEMTPELKTLLLKKCPPSACYRDLYNNTATHLFAYHDFPFPENTPLWCPRHVISKYFENYAQEFKLLPLVEFDTSVDLVTKNKHDDTWELTLSKYDVYPSGLVRISRWKETFDAIVAASGLHQEPFVPDIKNLTAWNKLWPDKVSHSNQFRRPEDYKDKDVVVVGGSISAVDIVRSLDGFAKSITISIDGPLESPYPIFKLVRSLIPKSVIIKSNIASFSDSDKVDGSILFKDGTVIKHTDNVIFCTGFVNYLNYLGDFVTEKDEATVRKEQETFPRHTYNDVPESHVVIGPKHPLNVYREIFLMSDPTLAFVGQPPFLSTPSHFDSQGIAVARVWSGRALLPNTELMNKSAAEFDTGASYFAVFDADRRRREPFVIWLNHHAKATEQDGGVELPVLRNYDDNYEEEGYKTMDVWRDVSEKNIQETKKHIRKHYL